ncbi:TonB-dependent receptor [Chitinophaga barathri]|uniref:TonB-dependent receptor n=1 Tax=Chitinophaga barathri TaxID=1647451 RepID=A0A3N4M9Y4_9BACT|nr:TonB-dependent receptor [Chitinophaga barathri]RPD40351.1 TonB-dependent receptor [Chitinophaga barathri]
MIPRILLNLTICLFLTPALDADAQGRLKGTVTTGEQPVPFASVGFKDLKTGIVTDESGTFDLKNVPPGKRILQVSAVGYVTSVQTVTVKPAGITTFNVTLQPTSSNLNEVVVSGTLRPVTKMESPVPVEVYSPVFFKKNPTPSIFDALQNVNGVRPQLNCNVCNTGDIHINGLEGPYTMVLIDGMPIVSALSTVYGLSGIPNSLVDRVEIVKGPASTLYGSEAVAGLINIITKSPSTAPKFTADVMATSWQEYSADLGWRFNAGTRAQSLLGVNYFNYQHPIDNNGDGFTDVTLQHRVSVFNKWNFNRKDDRVATIAARYFYEDRWGGQTQWNKTWRGTDSVYGESIFTSRIEVLGQYQLPMKEHVMFQTSFNYHDQNSVYGAMAFLAKQSIAFAQLTWDKQVGKHNLLAGLPFRYTFYDDNTVATASKEENKPDKTFLPGVFVQDEIKLATGHNLLLGMRYDYNSVHGNIVTPRLAYKWAPNYRNVLRLNAGTGYRVVSLFTEDHAALSGARTVVVQSELKPERSWNANLNYTKKIPLNNAFLNLDATLFYTYFTNRIMPDYSKPDTILYDNLHGNAISKGFSLNADVMFAFPLKVIAGVTLMDVYEKEGGVKTRQMLTERFSGTWSISYAFNRIGLTLDYTGNIYGPMLLPLQPNDPRPGKSPVWSIQNIQATKKLGKEWELYAGVKNLLNFLPPKNSIAHSHDPFDKRTGYNADGSVDPYNLLFDPTYVFAPNQGIRGFLGLRFTKQ